MQCGGRPAFLFVPFFRETKILHQLYLLFSSDCTVKNKKKTITVT